MTDIGAGRGWLNASAAASIRRLDALLGHPMQITEAGRTWDQQNAHWQHYLKYGKPIANRPGTSLHESGLAIDSDEAQRFVARMAEHGWVRTVYRWVNGKNTLVEPWHFEYRIANDQHRNDPVPGPSGGAQPETPTQKDEDDMSQLMRDTERGSVFLIDELGSDHVLDYISADISGSEMLTAAQAVWPSKGVPSREFDVANAIAQRRWAHKRNEIVNETVARLIPVIEKGQAPALDPELIRAAIAEALEGVEIDSKVDENTIDKIANRVLDRQHERLAE